MEYVEGETLLDRLQRGPLQSRRALEIAESLAETQDVLFSKLQTCGRGLTPSNVRLGKEGEVKLCRVSLAKRIEAWRTADSSYGQDRDYDETQEFVAYCAPERLMGHPDMYNVRTDVFELGAVLYHMLTGKPLFNDWSERSRSPQDVSASLPSIFPEEVRSLLSGMLATEQSARYQDYSQLRRDIRHASTALLKQKPHVFVSAKSEDYDHALTVYDYLMSQGIPTFFSERSLGRMANSDYRREIDRALDETTHLVVVTSSARNVTSSWVEAEWGLFIVEKRSGRKQGNLVSLLFGDMSADDLPPSPRYYESIPYGEGALRRLLEYVEPASDIGGLHDVRDRPQEASPTDKRGCFAMLTILVVLSGVATALAFIWRHGLS